MVKSNHHNIKKIYLTTSPQKTKKLGEFLIKKLIKKRKRIILGLYGELGGGKTTFLQGLAKALKIKGKILSPTFIIFRRFDNFYHFDCYRIEKEKEILDLGFKKIISDPKNLVVVEWADKIKKIMPPDTTWIKFEIINQKKRKIMIK